MRTALVSLLLIFYSACAAWADEPVSIVSPGLSPSQVDPQGRLIEDWGTVGVQLRGEGIVDGTVRASAVKVAGVIPAASVVSDHGGVQLTRTVFRSPIFPAGVDVLQLSLKETAGKEVDVTVTMDVSTGVQLGRRTARIGGRTVLVLPSEVVDNQPLLDWGYFDEAVSLPGWGKPQGDCDPAFRNIRAGMGGVPIVYRFAVPPRSGATVVLGLCESHWAEPRQRPVRCVVEGAASQTVDPVAKWGQHQPGALMFQGRDDNGDGRLELSVRPVSGAADQNPILNAIWIYPPGETPPLDKVIVGQWNDKARHYVDVGGENDQSIYPPGKMEFPVHLTSGGTQQLTFLVACPGGEAPVPQQSQWTFPTLERAARDVWRDWPAEK